jgi:methionine-R-sulfoxide reductase
LAINFATLSFWFYRQSKALRISRHIVIRSNFLEKEGTHAHVGSMAYAMIGGRITSEEKSTLSTYIGLGVVVVLGVVGVYLFFLAHQEKKETTGFDPNRPVPSDGILQRRLTPDEYAVVRGGTDQTAFQNKFWDNQRPGIYVDVITGEPLFTSVDKFDGGTGRPTFTKPISKDLLTEVPDNSGDMQRIVVRAKRSNAYLGHLFPDPASPTGQRYAVNSACFHFVPQEDMKAQGYEAYLPLLEKK